MNGVIKYKFIIIIVRISCFLYSGYVLILVFKIERKIVKRSIVLVFKINRNSV